SCRPGRPARSAASPPPSTGDASHSRSSFIPPRSQKYWTQERTSPNLPSVPLRVTHYRGNGCWVKENAPVAYVYSARDHVQFGFFRGATLRDPQGLLQGKGKFVRHIRVVKRTDIDEDAFEALLRQAAR